MVAFIIVSILVWGWMAWVWSNRNTQNVVFKLFLSGMTLWGIVLLVSRIKL